MVSSEMIHAMPSNGFGSPISPPDIFMENREVPSPSQFTDPSCTPPSMHSPGHYTSEMEKLDSFMKEEPPSPYGSYNCNMVPSSAQNAQMTGHPNFSYHNFHSADEEFINQNGAHPSNYPVMKPEPKITPDSGINSAVDQELREILNNPEFSKTFESLNETLQLSATETIPSMYFNQDSESQCYTQSQMQQLTLNDQQVQVQQQQPSDMFVPSFMAANSPLSESSETLQNSPRSVASPDSTISNDAASPHIISFEELIDGSNIKSEVIDSEVQALKPDFVLDAMMSDTIIKAGVSHCPQEWSIADVRQCLKKFGELMRMKLSAALMNINLNGPALLKLTPEQWAKFIESDDSRAICDFFENWLSRQGNGTKRATNVEQNVQVKVEVNTQGDMKQEKYDIPQAMLPLPVTEATMFQYKQPQMTTVHQVTDSSRRPMLQNSVDQQKLHHQQYLNIHQQVNLDTLMPQDTNIFSQHTAQFNQLNGFLSHAPRSQQNLCNSTVANQTQQQIPLGTNSQPATSTPIKSNSQVESQIPNLMQPLIPVTSVSPPVPLREGANGYLDDSGADLSALLQQHPPQQPAPAQHPTTIDQEEIMETDEDVEEEVPVSTTGSSGRTHIQLWQFLKELLANNKRYGSCIRWLDRQQGIFKIEDSVKVATLWGERKNRPQMNYDKLSRSIRQYYNKNIMKKTERSQRLVYQFCAPYGN